MVNGVELASIPKYENLILQIMSDLGNGYLSPIRTLTRDVKDLAARSGIPATEVWLRDKVGKRGSEPDRKPV